MTASERAIELWLKLGKGGRIDPRPMSEFDSMLVHNDAEKMTVEAITAAERDVAAAERARAEADFAVEAELAADEYRKEERERCARLVREFDLHGNGLGPYDEPVQMAVLAILELAARRIEQLPPPPD